MEQSTYEKITIRPATDSDLSGLYRLAEAMGAAHEQKYFEQCLAEQGDKKRVVLVGEVSGQLISYIQLIWLPLYPPFRRLEIPEIQDLNVVPPARQRGIGRRMVEACETLAYEVKKSAIGIGVGLHSRFGAAQRLYTKMGYVPDGAGVCYDDVPVRAGDLRAVDDLLTLKLIKTIL